MNYYIIKTLFFHYMMFDLKGHIRTNRALSNISAKFKPIYYLLGFFQLQLKKKLTYDKLDLVHASQKALGSFPVK